MPEVFITYQRSDGGVRTKHYSPEVVKGDKYLRELGSSLVNGNHVGTRSVVGQEVIANSDPLLGSSSNQNQQVTATSLKCPSDLNNGKTKELRPQLQIQRQA